jgi:hypothetical protein
MNIFFLKMHIASAIASTSAQNGRQSYRLETTVVTPRYTTPPSLP